MPDIPKWHAKGDWFDVCKCSIPCPCSFAQAPTFEDCNGVLVWHVREGRYGDVEIDGLNVLALGAFKGNVWAGETKVTIGIYIDERADERQREAMQMIFGGQAGGWPAEFAKNLGEMRGLEFARIDVDIADDLATWRAEIPGKVLAEAELLTGPTSRPGDKAQLHNPPGSEVGPGSVATWGRTTANKADGFGFKWDYAGRSSKHMGFDWSGPGGS